MALDHIYDGTGRRSHLRSGLVFVVLTHALLAGWHGLAHIKVPVALSPPQGAFVALVVMLLPVVGSALSFTRYRVQGAALVCLAMGAALAFGLAYHYLVASPDNVASVAPGPWHDHFIQSALAVLVSEALGTLWGAFAWRRWSRDAASVLQTNCRQRDQHAAKRGANSGAT